MFEVVLFVFIKSLLLITSAAKTIFEKLETIEENIQTGLNELKQMML